MIANEAIMIVVTVAFGLTLWTSPVSDGPVGAQRSDLKCMPRTPVSEHDALIKQAEAALKRAEQVAKQADEVSKRYQDSFREFEYENNLGIKVKERERIEILKRFFDMLP
jgi:hypothetical protein